MSYFGSMSAWRIISGPRFTRNSGWVGIDLPRKPSRRNWFIIARLFDASFINNTRHLDVRWYPVHQHKLLHDQNGVLDLKRRLHRTKKAAVSSTINTSAPGLTFQTESTAICLYRWHLQQRAAFLQTLPPTAICNELSKQINISRVHDRTPRLQNNKKTHLESCVQFCLSFFSFAVFSASANIFNAGESDVEDCSALSGDGEVGAGATFAATTVNIHQPHGANTKDAHLKM